MPHETKAPFPLPQACLAHAKGGAQGSGRGMSRRSATGGCASPGRMCTHTCNCMCMCTFGHGSEPEGSKREAHDSATGGEMWRSPVTCDESQEGVWGARCREARATCMQVRTLRRRGLAALEPTTKSPSSMISCTLARSASSVSLSLWTSLHARKHARYYRRSAVCAIALRARARVFVDEPMGGCSPGRRGGGQGGGKTTCRRRVPYVCDPRRDAGSGRRG